MDEILESVGPYMESVDMLLKAIADDDRAAFVAAIAIVSARRHLVEATINEKLETLEGVA